MQKEDAFWMAEALKQAEEAQRQGEVPVGALLINSEQGLIATGFNQVIQDNDPTAHAEIVVIRKAGIILNNYRLNQCSLYVTLEPCAMCAAAIVQARIKRLVFASRDFKAGAAGSVLNLLQGYPLNHQVQIDEGPLQEPCSLLLRNFFAQQR